MSKNYNATLQTNNSSLEEIIEQLNNMPDAGGSADPVLQDKTVTPTTSKQTVTADSGYDGLDTVTVNSMPITRQATPTISVNSSGLITASVTQTAGYVTAGTKSGTKQLTTQAAKTVTPSASSQTAVAKNVYTTGAITVAGDANLKAENIAEGVSIFGVTGTHSGSEDLNTELTTQENLISQLSTILDSKASGGGATSGFCTLYVVSDYSTFSAVFYQGENGCVIDQADESNSSIRHPMVVACGSLVCIYQNGFYAAEVSDGTIEYSQLSEGFMYRVPNTPDITVTINIETG